MIVKHTTYRFTVRLSSRYKQGRPELLVVTNLLRARGYDWDIFGPELTVIDCYDMDDAIELEQEINDLLIEHRVMVSLDVV